MIRRDQVNGLIGPLGGDSPSRYWSLLGGHDRLIGWPYTFGESLPAEFAVRLPFVREPGRRLLSDDPIVFQRALEGRSLRVYLRNDLEAITVRLRSLQNEIVLQQRGGATEIYSLRVRASTDRCREILSGAFPELYVEDGVPATMAGKVLVSRRPDV